MKKSLLIILPMIFVLLISVGCNKEEIFDQKQEVTESVFVERTFAYEECMKLYDRDYYVTYCVQSDLESNISEVIRLNPQIRISPVNVDTELETLHLLEIDEFNNNEQVRETENDISEVIKNGNIPTGFSLELYYENTNSTHAIGERSASYANRYFTDSGAVGIDVSEGGHTVPCSFYTRSWCCWKYRGYRTIGPYNTPSHSFRTANYTTRIGARMKAYTTIQAWNSMSKSFVY